MQDSKKISIEEKINKLIGSSYPPGQAVNFLRSTQSSPALDLADEICKVISANMKEALKSENIFIKKVAEKLKEKK